MWHSNFSFSLFNLFFLKIFYSYPIDVVISFYYYIKYELLLAINPNVIPYRMGYLLKTNQIL